MDYFSNCSKCNKYYVIYNKKLKCAEYLRYTINYYYHIFTLDDMYHNIKGSAIIEYSNLDKLEKYYINGKLHNSKGPAVIYYYNGQIYQEEYWIDNIHSRMNRT